MRLASLLKIRADEGRLVALVALLFALIQGGQGMGDNAASALFLLRYGVEFLPYMYMFLGALTFITTLAYSAGLGRFQRGRFFAALILGLILLLALERAVLQFPLPVLYPLVWLTINCLGMILGTLTWNVAGEVCDARQAKRLFPLFASAGILGSVLGNLLTGTVANLFGTLNLLVLYAILLVVVWLLLRRIARDYFVSAEPAGRRPSFLRDLRSGYDYVRGSPLLRLIAFASLLFSILFFSIAFPFNKVVSAAFTNEAQMAGFFGLFNSLTTLATFLVSLLLANRLYSRIGIVNSVLIMPLTYLFAFIVFAAAFSLSGAVLARSLQLVILSGLAGTAWNALFNVVPSQKRAQVLAFNNGVPAQAGVALSGLLLILGEQVLTTTQIFLMGIAVTLACGALIWLMRRAYGQALVEALRAGRLEVFSADQPAFAGLQGDAAALGVVSRALQDPKPTTRRLAAEILGRMQEPAAIPPLVKSLADPQPEVRAAAIASLGDLQAHTAFDSVVLSLKDKIEEVRLQALRALPRLDHPLPSEILAEIGKSLQDGSFRIQTQAAVTLCQLGQVERALPALRLWLNGSDQEAALKALETVGEISALVEGQIDPEILLPALQHPAAAIRKAACNALSGFQKEPVIAGLVGCLSDADESVRAAAAQALRQHTGRSASQVLAVLNSMDAFARDAALEALSPGNLEASAPLRSFALRESDRLRTLRRQFTSLMNPAPTSVQETSSRSLNYLRILMGTQIKEGESRLVKVVGLLGNTRTMELVRKSLTGGSLETRAAALEALETMGDKQLARQVIAFLEEEPQRASLSETLGMIMKSGERWPRALALRAAGELSLRDLMPQLQDQTGVLDELIRQAAIDSLNALGETITPTAGGEHLELEARMDTLQTVSKLERVLLLREVPIFAQLPPEDLERLALIASEQWHPPQAVLFRQGDPGDMLCILVNGNVKVISGDETQGRVIARRGPGDFVGEMAILDAAPRMATLITENEVRLLAIDGEAFKGILQERPSVALAVLQSLSRRLREMAS